MKLTKIESGWQLQSLDECNNEITVATLTKSVDSKWWDVRIEWPVTTNASVPEDELETQEDVYDVVFNMIAGEIDYYSLELIRLKLERRIDI